MTRAIVVYESVFGNARTIARAIAAGLSTAVRTDVVAADEAPAHLGDDVVLLVVGGPNHAFGMPRPSTRESAVDDYSAQITDTGTGLREWLESVHLREGLPAAAFDTRSGDHPLLTRVDHAARTAEKLLTRRGAEVVVPAEHYLVAGITGPLVAGEVDRARRWGTTLGAVAVTAGSTTVGHG